MADHRFDTLARMLATGASRRRTLRLLTGGIAGATLLRHALGAPSAKAQDLPLPQPACAQDSDCVRGDSDPCVGTRCVGGACSVFTVDCIGAHVCCGNGQCCADPGAVGCASDADCAGSGADSCTGARCEGGICAPFSVLCAPGFVCCGNGQCCAENGSSPCFADSDCAGFGGDGCFSGRCVSGACVPAPVSCPPGQTCRNGGCAPIASSS